MLFCLGVLALGPAAHALADTVDQQIKKLKDKSPFTRIMAAQELGHSKDIRAVKPLIAALKDKDDKVRGAAASALGEITDPSAVEPLIAALNDSEFYNRVAVAGAMGELKDPRFVEPLVAALHDSDSHVRRAVVNALTLIDDPRAAEPLKAALEQIRLEDIQRAAVRDALMSYLTTATYKSSAWSFSSTDTTIEVKALDIKQGTASAVAAVAFKGGSGQGIHLSNGATMMFGSTIGAASPLPIYGVKVFPKDGATVLVLSQTFRLTFETAAWKVTSTQRPNPADPADTPMSPL
jgi:vesicle coat complex subunit